MLVKWLDESQTPGFNKRDRLMGVIQSLGIAGRTQLITVTQWTEMEVDGAIQRIRKMGSTKEERDKWLRYWRPLPRGPYAYALGEKGLLYVRELLNDDKPFDVYSPRGQARHFMGVNEILCRVIRAGYPVETWLSQKEAMSFLYYQLLPNKSPVRPDGLIKVFGQKAFFLEFDTGTEVGVKLVDKFHKYLMLASLAPIHPVVWVTISETRRQFIQRKAMEALATFKIKYPQATMPARNPIMYAFLEGQETDFITGRADAEPFWR